MLRTIKKVLQQNTYHNLNTVHLDKQRLLENFQYLSNVRQGVRIAPVLKSNAYGHGLIETAKMLDALSAPFFCVDSLYEAYELLKANIKTPILIMGYVDPENLKVKKLPFSYAVYDEDLLQTIAKYQPHAGVHIKVDTGMHRLGIPMANLDDFLKLLPRFPKLYVEGLMSHFASADEPDAFVTAQQISNFAKVLSLVKSRQVNPQWIHCQASAGLLNLDVPGCNLARTGIAMYGINQGPNVNDNLKPVLSLQTKIIQVKQLQKGDYVGYGATFQAQKPMTIAVLPVGYYDGVDRRLSNKGFVRIDGTSCKIVGRVSMNLTTIDISNVENAHIGQTVDVFSNTTSDQNSITNAATLCDTIPYELLIHISPTIKRITA